MKPAENRHETAWQAWETGETGRIVKKSRVIFFKSSGFIGFPRLPGGFISVSYRFHRFHTPASISSAFCVPELHFGQTGVREPKNPMPNMMKPGPPNVVQWAAEANTRKFTRFRYMVRGTLEPQTGAHVGRATLAFKGAFKSATAALGNSLPPYLTVCDRQEGIGGNEFMTHPSSPPTPESILADPGYRVLRIPPSPLRILAVC